MRMASGWNFTGALYHVTQNSWTIGLGTAGNDNIGCAGAGLLCSGDFNEASFVVDYVINKHYDVYGGVELLARSPTVSPTGSWAPPSAPPAANRRPPSCSAFASRSENASRSGKSGRRTSQWIEPPAMGGLIASAKSPG